MKLRLLGAVAALVLVAGCAGSDIGSTVAVEGCRTYNKLLPVATAANNAGKLSVAQRRTVTFVRNSVGKGICELDAPPTDAELIQLGIKTLVDGGVQALQAVVDAVK